jgi:hypothetical protein
MSGKEGPSGPMSGRQGPSALPPVRARAVAFAAILVAGLCGLLIGRALADIQCEGDCTVATGVAGLVGGVIAAAGVAVVAVLVLRAMGEWQARGYGEKKKETRS